MENRNVRGQGLDGDVRGQGLDGDVRGQGLDGDVRGQGPDDVRGQGLDGDVRGQGPDDVRGQGIDDVRCQGLNGNDTRGQGFARGDTRGQGSTENNARGEGPTKADARGQGLSFEGFGNDRRFGSYRRQVPNSGTRGQGSSINDLQSRSVDQHEHRSRGEVDLEIEDPGPSRVRTNRERKRRRREWNSSSEDSDNDSRSRRGRNGQSRGKRRYYYYTEPSSNESDVAPTKSKRTRRSKEKYTDNILNKFLTIIKDVRGSDKPKMSYNNNVIPEFDPMTKEQTVLTWITKVEECSEIYGWDEKETIHYSLQKLCGVAKSWYQALPTLLYSWSEWKQKLLESFPSREDYAELLTEMLSKRVRYGESLENYYYTKINLLNRCKLSGKQAVDCLLHGVDDRAVKVGAQAAQFVEPEQILKYFRSVKVGNSRENCDYHKKNRIDKIINPLNNVKSAFSKPGSNNLIKCFNCNEHGHPSFKCDKPLTKCSNCDRIGHQVSNCYRNKTNVTSNSGTVEKNEKLVSELGVSSDANNKYIMDVVVNGTLLKCHLDLGSQCSLMRESDMKSLSLNLITDTELPLLRGIGTNLTQPLGMIVANVTIQNITETVNLYVVNDDVLRYPVLIGHSFTEKPDLVITKTPSEVILTRVLENPKVHLTSRDNVVLTKNKLTVIHVVCTTLQNGYICVNGSIRGNEGQEYYLIPGTFEVVNKCCALLGYNISNNEITINKNALITRATHSRIPILNACEVTISTIESDANVINCNPSLTLEQRQALQNLLLEYKICFSTGLSDLGFTNCTEMKIELTDSEPIVYRPYRLSYSERSLVRDMVKEMLDNGIVRESSSPYASPIVLVKKKTGEKRLCVDYRALNRKTKKEHYPLPRIDDQLDLLAGNNMFTSLDLASGYYQIQIEESSRDKTAFVTNEGQFEYNRMPFGLVNAPSIFQKTMNKILADAKIKYALVYMDDILIPSKDFQEGLIRLTEVLEQLKGGGLTLKMNKCKFFLNEIEFLGFEVSAKGIKPGLRKTEAVSKFPTPKNQHELRQFLGLSGFFRRFIKNYAIIAAPLTDLLKKDHGWVWDAPKEESFARIRKLLSERPLLSLYDPQAETHLHTDASKQGLAGILLQRNGKGVLQPVSYFSRKTTIDEQKYHSFELETLAIIASLSRFRVYLLGIPFTIQTDCNAVRSTLLKRDLIPRIARWWIQLQEFDCIIEYRPGSRMSHVDALSRNPVGLAINDNHVLDVLTIGTDEQNWIITVQSADDEIVSIKNILENPNTADVADIFKNFKLKNGRLYRIIGDEIKWVVPKGARWQILKRNHDDVGHYGYEKTLERIKKNYWFKRMRRFVKKYVSACLECAHHKKPGGKREGELHPIEKISIPFHTVHADHLGPFVKSKSGNCYLLVLIDSFTKFLNITPVKNTKSSTTIKVLRDHISFFGVPTRLITDRGSSFTSKVFKEFITECGTKHVLNAVATPRANGQVERFNRTITEALATSNHGLDEKCWDERIHDIQIGINTTIHKTTQKSPSELLFGFNINHKSQGILSTIINDTLNIVSPNELKSVRNEASEKIKEQQEKDRQYYNKKRKPSKNYKIGDLVRIERQVPHDGQSQKLVVKYQGPYRIVKVLQNDRFLIEDTPLSRKGRRYEAIVAIDKMQPWVSFDRDFDDDSSGQSDDDSNKDIEECNSNVNKTVDNDVQTNDV